MSFETTATIASFGGKLLKLKHKSASTNTDMALNLYLPPQALKSSAKVPVLFYLSGLTCTGDNCSEKGFFQHGASEKGIAVVYPDTSPSKLSQIKLLSTWLTHLLQGDSRYRVRMMHTISALVRVSTSMQRKSRGQRGTTCTHTSQKNFQMLSSLHSMSLIRAESALQGIAWVATVL